MNKNIALLLALYFFATTTIAQEQCKQEQEINYQQCDVQIDWYLGGALGFSETDINRGRIQQYFDQNNLDVNNVKIDENSFGGSIFLGYQFNSYFALEAGYLDFGEREVTFSSQTDDIAAYYDSAEHIYPQSADGLYVSVIASWPITEDLKLSAKLGYFDWEGDYITFDEQGNQGSDNISDKDMLLSGELNYRLTEKTQLFLSYQRVELVRDTNDMWGLGLRYYFGSENKQSPAKTKPAPQPVIEKVVLTKPKDSDGDGVYDDDDVCANSALIYQVDSRGCTLLKEQWLDFSLVIHYANDSAEIAPEYNKKIIALAEFINQNKVKTLTVFGHTSATGSERYNMKLSKQRAHSVAKKLTTDFGIDNDIINAVGKGETDLKVTGNNEQAHQQNRRIELTIKERLMLPVKHLKQ